MKTKIILTFFLTITVNILFSQNNRWLINAYVGEPAGISVEKEFLKHFSGELAFGINELFYDENICEQYICSHCTQLSNMYNSGIITKYKINYNKIGFYFGTEIQITFYLTEIQPDTSPKCNPLGVLMITDPQKEMQMNLGILPGIGITYPIYKDKLYFFSEASYYIPGISFKRTNPQFRAGLKYSF